MKALFAALLCIGLASAIEKTYTVTGESEFYIDFTDDDDYFLREDDTISDIKNIRLRKSDVEPKNGTTDVLVNSTLNVPAPTLKLAGKQISVKQSITTEDKPIAKIVFKTTGILKYKGRYLSQPLDGQLWRFQYLINAYGSLRQNLQITLAEFYTITLDFEYTLFDINLLEQNIDFVSPYIILKQKAKGVDVPFDLRVLSRFRIKDLLRFKFDATDSMKADFDEQLDPVVKEVFKFAFAEMDGTNYVAEAGVPDINDVTSYLPTWPDDFSDNESQVFMNKYTYAEYDYMDPGIDEHLTADYNLPIILTLLKKIDDPKWAWKNLDLLSFWVFGTRTA